MGKVKDTYKETKTFEFPNCIVKVHIPDLTDEERARRMKQVEKAAAELIKSAIDGRRRKNGTAN